MLGEIICLIIELPLCWAGDRVKFDPALQRTLLISFSIIIVVALTTVYCIQDRIDPEDIENTKIVVAEVSAHLEECDDRSLPKSWIAFHAFIQRAFSIDPEFINDRGQVIDSFGLPLHYSRRHPIGMPIYVKGDLPKFYIWSNGPDKMNDGGGNDDIANWEQDRE